MAITDHALLRHAPAPPRGRGAGPFVVPALAGVVVVLSPWLWSLPPGILAIAATALVLVGVPHGAVDHRVARPLLRPRLGRAWFAAFAAPYLGAAALVLLGWVVAPVASLVAFLAISVFHFGTEDAEGEGPVARLARGGAPVALPILMHPEGTARFFETLAGAPLDLRGLQLAAWAWVPLAVIHLARLVASRRTGAVAEVAAVVAVFAVAPPLAAFAFYFVALHSPRHMDELARRHDAHEPARGWRWAVLRSVPLSAATFTMGYLVFRGLSGGFEERFLQATFWGLAALTVPHVLLHHIDRRWGGERLT